MTRDERKAIIYLLDAVTPDLPRKVIEAVIFELEAFLAADAARRERSRRVQ